MFFSNLMLVEYFTNSVVGLKSKKHLRERRAGVAFRFFENFLMNVSPYPVLQVTGYFSVQTSFAVSITNCNFAH